MLVLPSVAAAYGPHFLLRLVGILGLAWLAVWRLTLRRRGEAMQRRGPACCALWSRSSCSFPKVVFMRGRVCQCYFYKLDQKPLRRSVRSPPALQFAPRGRCRRHAAA